ncbi:flavodoxin [Saccharicrinis sp. GN24d3]|uniref:flavodoxin n=1 Tax=Saccharicrinis sp. GN24d3 TaxID=3458416 RepID=UPI004035EFB7
MSKSLVIYYSLQGHTKRVAEMIANKTGADIFKLDLEEDYNLGTVLEVSKQHIKNQYIPDLKPFNLNLDEYEQIIIGTPVWWYTYTAPIRSFLHKHSLNGKTVRFFSTHAGANGSTFTDLEVLVTGAKILKPRGFYTYENFSWDSIENEVSNWLEV